MTGKHWGGGKKSAFFSEHYIEGEPEFQFRSRNLGNTSTEEQLRLVMIGSAGEDVE